MCAQHYTQESYYSSWIRYPDNCRFYGIGVLMDSGPTPYPPYMNQYFDSYNYGHVRAHLVLDPADGIVSASTGGNPVIVGGRLVCVANNQSVIRLSSYQGNIICDITERCIRCIYVGGVSDVYGIEAVCYCMNYDPQSMTCIQSDVHRLSLGSPSISSYWWFQPSPTTTYQHQYAAWCESFDSIWDDVVADGRPLNSPEYPYGVWDGRETQCSLSSCNIIEPTYEFKPQGAEFEWLELALSFGQPDGRRVRRYLADSYVAAASELPKAAANTLQNMLELGSLISSLVQGNFSSLVDFSGLKDLWLAYRYSYNTTKLDISDYRHVTNRLLALSDIPVMTTHGVVVRDGYRVRTSIKVRADEVIPHDVASFFETFNHKLSLVNAWDMIPWSFVVDWFLHVGDVLERLEKNASAFNLNPVSCWSSIERLGGKFYLRFPYTYSGGASVFQDFRCSDKTFIMRIADAMCLFSR